MYLLCIHYWGIFHFKLQTLDSFSWQEDAFECDFPEHDWLACITTQFLRVVAVAKVFVEPGMYRSILYPEKINSNVEFHFFSTMFSEVIFVDSIVLVAIYYFSFKYPQFKKTCNWRKFAWVNRNIFLVKPGLPSSDFIFSMKVWKVIALIAIIHFQLSSQFKKINWDKFVSIFVHCTENVSISISKLIRIFLVKWCFSISFSSAILNGLRTSAFHATFCNC